MFDQGDELGLRLLIRAVIIAALKDLGNCSDLDRSKIFCWIRTDIFYEMCSFAGWSEEWLVDVFNRVDDLEGVVRREISDQCVHMLKFVA